VVGVHSAKFTTEKATHNVRKAVLRYEIEHPVVNDKDFVVWQHYGVRAWPTLMFIDPEGKVIARHEGEFPLEALDGVVGEMVKEFDAQGLMDRRPLRFKLEREKEWERPLSFPGKVEADAASGRLFIADSNHNRIVVASLDGEVMHIIGSGRAGLADGGFGEAAFNDPQGMALDGVGAHGRAPMLYVADTKNHAIRKVDLINRTVQTIAGTGEQAMMSRPDMIGAGASTPLSSPWDVALNDGTLYIAMAGFHQLWRLELETNEVRPHAGNGRERIVDGPLASAQLAQPSGIATDGAKLYFTDSETSAVRTADLGSDGRVATMVGLDLFTFGDVDGVGDQVRLQHPLGIDVQDGVLFIADTYNNKVKRGFPATRGVTAFLGSGEPGQKDGIGREAQFHEPGGLSVADGNLYIADTNNHAIRVADLQSQEVTTLELKGI
jgi:hypothetical protein